jgi:hypothetical protein
MVEALLVMMNNYFHDLAVAFLFASSILAHVVLRHWPGRPSAAISRILRRIAWGSLIWVLLGGVVRVWFYQEYEWLPRAGTAQIPALAAKHVLMFALTAWGLVGVVRLRTRSVPFDPPNPAEKTDTIESR